MESDCFLSESPVEAVPRESNTTYLASVELHVDKLYACTQAHMHTWSNTIINLELVWKITFYFALQNKFFHCKPLRYDEIVTYCLCHFKFIFLR